jgi:hypothetical protein
VTTTHVARIAIRNADMVAAARHYGLTIAKADLVPCDANLLVTPSARRSTPGCTG